MKEKAPKTYEWLKRNIPTNNPPPSAFLHSGDRQIIDYTKTQIKLVSPIATYISPDTGNKRNVAVFEIPVFEKQDGKAVVVATTKVTMYVRTGTGSRRHGQGYAERLFASNDKYEVIAESPFLHNVAYKEWGMEKGRDYAPVMWLPFWGIDTENDFQVTRNWLIKPDSTNTTFYGGDPMTSPAFPSRDWEKVFARRWGHRTFFYV